MSNEPCSLQHTSSARWITAVHCLLLWLTFCLISSACAAQPASNSDAQQLLSQANEQLAKEAFDEAFRLATQAGQLAADSPQLLQRAAEIMYLSGHARESLPLFDRVVALVPQSAAENWQRGIALCTCGDFERGAAQFKTHHDVNPDDVENSAWYFLCIAKTQGIPAARESVIPSRGDGRQPMMSVLGMLQGKLQPADVLRAVEEAQLEGRRLQTAKFYGDLYVGLYFDALGQKAEAQEALKRSLTYGAAGYMVDTARVYLEHRFGDAADAHSEASK